LNFFPKTHIDDSNIAISYGDHLSIIVIGRTLLNKLANVDVRCKIKPGGGS